MSKLDNFILLARIGGAHGIGGEVRAQVFGEEPLAVGNYGPLRDAAGRAYEITRARPSKSAIILTIAGISDRNAAEALNGTELFIDRDSLPDDALEEDEVYQADLIGLEALDAGGTSYGSVVAVHDFGAGTILELQPGDGPSVMIPFSLAAVPEIDADAATLRVDPLAAGLTADDPADAPRGGKKARRGSARPRRAPPRAKDGGP